MSGRQPNAIAAELVALINILLPGDDLFPNASAVGLQAVLADRLRARRGDAGVDQLLGTIEACGGPLHALADDQRHAVVARLEQDHAELFALVRAAAYLGYYESPAVQAAIRTLGHPYHGVLLPEGYDVAPFDPEVDTPAHGRGSYKATGDVERVDLDLLKLEAGDG